MHSLNFIFVLLLACKEVESSYIKKKKQNNYSNNTLSSEVINQKLNEQIG